MSAPPAIANSRLRSIDVLRGIAVLAVLAIHIPHDAPGGWREHPFFFPAFLAEFGYLGVPLFILISGFCIHRAAAIRRLTTGAYTFSWMAFWKRRFFRLYPPYLAAIVLSLASAFYLHDRFDDPWKFLGWDLATHLLLVHNLTDEFNTGLGNGAFWSLGTEEQLYALYAVALGLLIYAGHRRALWIAAVVTIGWRIAGPLVPEYAQIGGIKLGSWYHWPFHYWLHWVLGAIAVDAHLGNIALPRWCRSFGTGFALVTTGTVFNRVTFEMAGRSSLQSWLDGTTPASLQIASNLGEILILVGFFCFLNGGLQREILGAARSRLVSVLSGIGAISYSIYLVHMPVIFTIETWLPMGASPAEWLPRALIHLSACLLAGLAFFLGIERWFLRGGLPRLGAVPKVAPEQAS